MDVCTQGASKESESRGFEYMLRICGRPAFIIGLPTPDFVNSERLCSISQYTVLSTLCQHDYVRPMPLVAARRSLLTY